MGPHVMVSLAAAQMVPPPVAAQTVPPPVAAQTVPPPVAAQTVAPPVAAQTVPPAEAEPLADGELLIEEVSIDGMCGVY
jgi:mycofactocin precursor